VGGSTHLRGIVIAGVLAAVALGLGFVTLAMNQTASRASATTRHVVLPLKHRVPAAATSKPAAAKAATAKAKPVKKVDPNLTAALAAGLPLTVAKALAASPVAVVQLSSASDSVAQLAAAEAKSGAGLAGAAYVVLNIDRDGGPVERLTRLLGSLPAAPASLVYARPGKLVVTLAGFNDRTIVEQAVADALASVPPAAAPSGKAAA
jgi:hypothetical protein